MVDMRTADDQDLFSRFATPNVQHTTVERRLTRRSAHIRATRYCACVSEIGKERERGTRSFVSQSSEKKSRGNVDKLFFFSSGARLLQSSFFSRNNFAASRNVYTRMKQIHIIIQLQRDMYYHCRSIFLRQFRTEIFQL